VQKQKIYI